VDARTDLYSTGIVLFEMLTGHPPFRGDRAAAVAYQHISEAPLPPSSLNPKVSPALDVVVLHSLEKDKFERFQTAAEFREEVALAASGEVPQRKVPAANDFNSTLFGVNPAAAAGSEAALRQLSSESSDRGVRTQNRPPVAWIWAGIALIIAMLVALAIWVVNLPASTIGTSISVEVPDIVGQQYESGAQTLQDLELVVSRLDTANDEVPRGEIIRTNPEAGTRVAADQVVKVYVSQGPASVSVPALSNLGEEAAKQALTDRKLVVGSTTLENSSTLPAGTVLRSSPEGGAVVQEGDTVDLIVSSGLVTVPPVAGQPISTANSMLSALQLTVVAKPDYNCTGLAVTGQSLAAGDHPQRSEITVTYCAG
jgi:beta-lactam-binding protein with PASTA domain